MLIFIFFLRFHIYINTTLFYTGKIDKSDWNVKEIERKIEENKIHAKHVKNGSEKVPKWSRPQFDDKVLLVLLVNF